MGKTNWIRIVYLYLMTTIGLVVLIIGSVSLINLGLKTFIFTNAERDYYSEKPIALYVDRDIEQVKNIKDCEDLTQEDKDMMGVWLDDYDLWKQESEKVDYARAQRERDAAQALAMILVGLPVYLYHWGVIKKDKKKKKGE